MKRTLKTVATVALAGFVVASCSSLNKMKRLEKNIAYKVTPEMLEAKGGQVDLKIDATIPAKYFNKKVTLVATPVLKFQNGGEKAYDPKTFQGEKVQGNNEVVPYATEKTVNYSGTVPFEEGMRVSGLYVKFQGSKGKKSADYESRKIAENYPYMFARDGKMIMWGRSITYRMGASVPLALTGLLEDPDINYGWMRRIASSTILQFLQHPDFLEDRIPTLGFYGAFEPAIQGYSCRGSVFWMGKLFLALYLPANNPFWNAVENEGAWTDFEKDRVYCKYAEDAHILVTDYPNIGASELRSTTSHSSSNYHCVENYNRLSYNSEFPWQADGKNGEVAMSYVVKNKEGKWEPLRNYSFKKYEDGFYCREAWLESDEAVYFQLAELPLPDGILRIDKVSSPSPVEVRMGHYALPEKQGKIRESVIRLDGKETYVIDNGVYRLGMTTWEGWKQMEFVHAEELHPDSRNSVVIDASDRCEGEKVYITLQLWSKSGSKDDDVWNPVSKICFDKSRKQFEVVLKDGNVKRLKW